MPLTEDDIRKNEAEEEPDTAGQPAISIPELVAESVQKSLGHVEETYDEIVLAQENCATWNDLLPQRSLVAAWQGNAHTGILMQLLLDIRGQNERIAAGIEKLVELAGKGKK